MRRSLLRLLFLVPFALMLSIVASGLFLAVAAVVDPVIGAFAGDMLRTAADALSDAIANADDPTPLVDGAFSAAAKIAFTLLVLPPLFVALVSEVIAARSYLWQVGATALVTAAVPFLARGGGRAPTADELRIAFVLALAGAVAGTVYWLVAGRSAGLFQRDEARILTAKAENRPAKE